MPLTHHALIQVAAQAELRHNDDTPIHLSLIHLCELNGINPFDYLMAREQNADRVTKVPTECRMRNAGATRNIKPAVLR